jgi:glucose/mannose-6-phosphate isomerase
VTHPQYLDTLDMWEATAGLPEQLTGALDAASRTLADVRLPAPGDVRAVVVFGAGACGLAGDVVAAYGDDHSSVPIWVGKGYDAPAFVGPRTLVFAISHSGDGRETLAATKAAHERGAPVITVSGDGALADLARSAGFPRFDFPAGPTNARTAWGGAIVPVLVTLSHLGLTDDAVPSLTAAAAALGRRRDTFVVEGNPADEVAGRIGRTIPLIYGSTGLAGVAAQRWKTQVNQNAKTPAFFAVQPDLSHNEVAGWGQHGDVTRQILTLITLRHRAEHPEVARRFELVVAATDEVMAEVIPVWAEGDDDLARFFDLALFGDFVSLYLAGREGIDPGPVATDADVQAGLR